MKNLTSKQKKILAIIGILLLLLLLALFMIFYLQKNDLFSYTPTLAIVTPPKQSVSAKDTFTVDVSISDMGDAIYPAASISVAFNSSKLEFLGVEEGNIMILDDEKSNLNSVKLPDWSADTKRSNEIGQINVMYLDMTGGKYAFSKELITTDGDNILLRLKFRLRGSAKAGDIYELSVKDAVLAASEESNSLNSANGTLKTQNGRIVVGE